MVSDYQCKQGLCCIPLRRDQTVVNENTDTIMFDSLTPGEAISQVFKLPSIKRSALLSTTSQLVFRQKKCGWKPSAPGTTTRDLASVYQQPTFPPQIWCNQERPHARPTIGIATHKGATRWEERAISSIGKAAPFLNDSYRLKINDVYVSNW